MDLATAHRRRWATLGVLCISLLVIGLDNTILNVALPTVSTALHASDSQLQWIVDAYTLVFAGLLLTAGSIGDRFGRRRALCFGLAVFAAGSVWAAFSGSADTLIVARGLTGVGAAFIMPSTLSVLTNSFRDPAERTKAIGIWAAVSGLGIVLGPAGGGWLLSHFWWGSAFLINVPIAISGIVAAVWLVPESRDDAAPRIDYVGAVLSSAGLATLVWGVIQAPAKGWTSTSVLSAFAICVGLLGAFGSWELHTDEPMLDLSFFRNARFSAAAVAVTLAFFALFGAIFALTQYLQFVLHYSPLQTGIRVLPVATLIFGAPLAVTLSRRFGDKLVVVAGLAVVAAAFILMAATTTQSGYLHAALVLALLGLGLGMTMTPATDAVMGAIPPAKAGVGSAMNETTRQVGGALGVAILGSVLSSAYGSRLGSTVDGVQVPDAAQHGIGEALQAAANLPGAARATLTTAADSAFVHGMSLAAAAAVGATALAAAVALIWLPARADANGIHVEEQAETKLAEVSA